MKICIARICKIRSSAQHLAEGVAQKIAADTGAQVYWMDAQASTGQIAKDNKSIAAIAKLLGE